jgi:hypothetical protein
VPFLRLRSESMSVSQLAVRRSASDTNSPLMLPSIWIDLSGFRDLPELTYLEAAQWFKLKGCVAEENRIAPARRRQFRPGLGLTCLVTFAAEIDFLDSSVWLIGIFALNLN